MVINLRRPAPDVLTILATTPGVLRVLPEGHGCYLLETAAGMDCREEIAERIVQQGWGLLELSWLTIPLEETLLHLIREAEEAQS
jgi:hypothetical protein